MTIILWTTVVLLAWLRLWVPPAILVFPEKPIIA